MTTLAEAQAQCRAAGVDLRVSGRGMTDCIDRIAPFCVGDKDGVRVDTDHELPFCVDERVSPEKAAVLLKEAELRQAALALQHPPAWLVIAGGAALVGLLYVAFRG